MRIGALLVVGALVGPVGLPAQESTGRHTVSPPAATRSEAAPLPAAPVESSDYLSYTGYAEMEAFLAELAAASPEVTIDTLAVLSGERPPEQDEDPPLILVSLRRQEPGDAPDRTRRVSVLIIGSQHGDEQSGKEAALQAVRDLATGPLNSLLDAMDVFVVPMPNPWGVATNQRENAKGIDLNRDHSRLETTATAGLHAFFAEYRPEVVLDLHELGLAAYDAEIGLATQPNADSALIKFGRYRILPHVAYELVRSGFSFHEYVLPMPEPGTAPEGVDHYFTYGPLLASYARNAFALRGSISMLFEVASSREILDLDRRTAVHGVALRAALEVIAASGDEILAETATARQGAGMWSPGTEQTPSADALRPFVLRATYERDPRQPELTWLVRVPEGINTGTTDRWKPAIQPRLLITPPAGYLVDPGQTELVATLLRHGFRLFELVEERRLRLGRYPVASGPVDPDSVVVNTVAAADSAAPTSAGATGSVAEARIIPKSVDDLIEWSEETVPAGTVYVDLRQPARLLIIAILEPWSQDSWFEGAGVDSARGDAWYPVARVDEPLSDDVRPVPSTVRDSSLDGP